MAIKKWLYDRLLMVINVIKLYHKKIAIKGDPIDKGIKRRLKYRLRVSIIKNWQIESIKIKISKMWFAFFVFSKLKDFVVI